MKRDVVDAVSQNTAMGIRTILVTGEGLAVAQLTALEAGILVQEDFEDSHIMHAD